MIGIVPGTGPKFCCCSLNGISVLLEQQRMVGNLVAKGIWNGDDVR